MNEEQRKWMPQLSPDGVFFCSPRCGGGKFCRREWYDAAVSNAQALADRMGPGWEPRIWENLGWHYEVRNGSCRIMVDEDRREPFDAAAGGYPILAYSAWIEPEGAQIGHSILQFIAHAQTPEDALGFATQDARSTILRIDRTLAALLEEI